jgi:hypothetical protein
LELRATIVIRADSIPWDSGDPSNEGTSSAKIVGSRLSMLTGPKNMLPKGKIKAIDDASVRAGIARMWSADLESK